MRYASHFAQQWSVVCVAILAVALAGCAELPGVEKPLDISYYPKIEGDFSPRAKPADESVLSDDGLLKSDHVRIGMMYVTQVDEVCFDKEDGKESCKKKDHGIDSASRLIAEAASEGADLVVFEKKNEPEMEMVSVEGGKCDKREWRDVQVNVCIREYNGRLNCKLKTQSQLVCTSHDLIYGMQRGHRSVADLWRFDPELANLVRLTDPMDTAITGGNLPEIKRLIAAGMSVGRSDGNGRWPLARAIEAQQYEAAGLLLEHGANPNENAGATLALVASQCNQLLLDRMIAKGGMLGPVVQGVLEKAVSRPCPAGFVEYLFKQAPGARASDSLIALASEQKDPALLAVMFRHGGRPTKEALVKAAENANVVQAQALLAAGVNPNVWHEEAKFYLVTYMANHMHRDMDETDMARLEILRALLEAGADPNKKGAYQYTALAWSVCYPLRFEAAVLLIEHGANLNVDLPCGGGTPLGKVEMALADPSTDAVDRPRYEKLREILIRAGARRPS